MNAPSKMRFEIINGITEGEVKNSEFIIYAHRCSKGVYVGMTNDPVKRWQEHVSDAMNQHAHNTEDDFKLAIKACRDNFKHYIIATASFEKSARKKEAAAIKFYSEGLNMRIEKVETDRDYGFKKIGNQIPIPVFLEKKGNTGMSHSREDSDRKSIVAEIFEEFGRKRVRCTSGQSFEEGLLVECARDERDKFDVGDLVIVKVALSEKNEKKYLVAAKTSPLIKASKA